MYRRLLAINCWGSGWWARRGGGMDGGDGWGEVGWNRMGMGNGGGRGEVGRSGVRWGWGDGERVWSGENRVGEERERRSEETGFQLVKIKTGRKPRLWTTVQPSFPFRYSDSAIQTKLSVLHCRSTKSRSTRHGCCLHVNEQTEQYPLTGRRIV